MTYCGALNTVPKKKPLLLIPPAHRSMRPSFIADSGVCASEVCTCCLFPGLWIQTKSCSICFPLVWHKIPFPINQINPGINKSIKKERSKGTCKWPYQSYDRYILRAMVSVSMNNPSTPVNGEKLIPASLPTITHLVSFYALTLVITLVGWASEISQAMQDLARSIFEQEWNPPRKNSQCSRKQCFWFKRWHSPL